MEKDYKMKTIKFNELSRELIDQLMKGAFLTVKDKNGKLNTMTIAWGTIGYMWFKPVFIVMVRKSRYTFNIIQNAQDFTVSFPLNDQLKKELMTCGTKSGRDMDKFKECHLDTEYVDDIYSPMISACDLHVLCKIIYKQPLDPEYMDKKVMDVYGSEKDYHTLYFGEIISAMYAG